MFILILTVKTRVHVTPCPLTKEIHLGCVEDLISNTNGRTSRTEGNQLTVFRLEDCEGC